MTQAADLPVALITGASRGLGTALAEALAPTHHIVAVAKTVGALEELDDRISAAGGQATLAPMDITVEAAMQQLCRSIFDRWGKQVGELERPEAQWNPKEVGAGTYYYSVHAHRSAQVWA